MCPTDVKIKGVKRFLSELFFLLFETKFSEIFMVLGQVLIADFGTCWALTYFILECVKKKAKNGVICSRCPGDDRVVVLSFNSSYFESYYLKTDWTNGRTRYLLRVPSSVQQPSATHSKYVFNSTFCFCLCHLYTTPSRNYFFSIFFVALISRLAFFVVVVLSYPVRLHLICLPWFSSDVWFFSVSHRLWPQNLYLS